MYIYQADTYCDSCGNRIAAELEQREFYGGETIALRDDSDHYPQGGYPSEPTDAPDHCASGADCLEGIDLADYGLSLAAPLYGAEGRTIGALLSDELTEYGINYLWEMIEDETNLTPYQRALHNLWRETFADYL